MRLAFWWGGNGVGVQPEIARVTLRAIVFRGSNNVIHQYTHVATLGPTRIAHFGTRQPLTASLKRLVAIKAN